MHSHKMHFMVEITEYPCHPLTAEITPLSILSSWLDSSPQFMIKFNEITSKTGVDFVTQLIELYSAELR